MKRILPGIAALALALTASDLPSLPAADVGPGGFEMTTYDVGFLYRGSKWTPEHTPEIDRLQQAHLANIQKMGESGKLLVAGPFMDNGDLRGMFVFRVGTMEEAKSLSETDPAVQAGRLRIELHPWYAAKNIRVTATAEKSEGGR